MSKKKRGKWCVGRARKDRKPYKGPPEDELMKLKDQIMKELEDDNQTKGERQV